MYDEMAWQLYSELWDISGSVRPELTVPDRRSMIDQLVEPVLSHDVADDVKATLLIRLFQAVLAARMAPVLGGDAR